MMRLDNAVLQEVMQVNHAENFLLTFRDDESRNREPFHLFDGFRSEIVWRNGLWIA